LRGQQKNNSAMMEENQVISKSIQELEKRSAELRQGAETKRHNSELLDMSLDGMRANLSAVQEYLGQALETSNDDDAPETAVLREMAADAEHKREKFSQQADFESWISTPKRNKKLGLIQTSEPGQFEEEKGTVLKDTLGTLQETVVSLKKQQGERIAGLNEKFDEKMEQEKTTHQSLMQEHEILVNRRKELQTIHGELVGADKLLEANGKDLQHRVNGLQGYAKRMSAAAAVAAHREKTN